MNKNDYLFQLRAGLKRLPKEEVDHIIAYYEEYFEEAGEENELEVIEELGNPKDVAGKVIAEMAVKYMDRPAQTVKKGLSSIKIGLMALFAAPVALPLSLALVLLVLAVTLAALMLYAALWMAALGALVSGAVSLVVAGFTIFSSFASGLAILGAGFLCIGFGLLITYAGIAFGRWVFRRIANLLRPAIRKGGRV